MGKMEKVLHSLEDSRAALESLGCLHLGLKRKQFHPQTQQRYPLYPPRQPEHMKRCHKSERERVANSSSCNSSMEITHDSYSVYLTP